jgi:hypothetical protein
MDCKTINIGMILEFTREKVPFSTDKAKKGLKSLIFCLMPLNFKEYFRTTISKPFNFCTPKIYTVDKKTIKSEKLQMKDILIPDAVLSAFVIEMDDPTKKFLEETEKKQEEVLKLKEVNEERLRMVVQF